MNVFDAIERKLVTALTAAVESGNVSPKLKLIVDDPSLIRVQQPADPSHGDAATSVAVSAAKATRLPPHFAAAQIASVLESLGAKAGVARVEVVKPGFVNIVLTDAVVTDYLVAAATADDGVFGATADGEGRAAIVEFVSANPTGPMHVGHARGAVIGDAVASLLDAAGYGVVREFYVNDAGGQVSVLADSAVLRWREALGEDVGELPDGHYRGDYLKPVGQALADVHGAAPMRNAAEAKRIAGDFAVSSMLAAIRGDLASMGIAHDVFTSEKSVATAEGIAQAVARLRAAGLVYDGEAGTPEGRESDKPARTQALFRSTAYGDDKDRAMLKEDGSSTYFAADIVYHADKARRAALASAPGARPLLVDVWGADHHGYVIRMKGAVAALTGGGADFEPLLCSLVNLTRDGIAVPMSKRNGEFVTARDVVDEVGPDAVRFMMLMRQPNAGLDFDLARVVRETKDNPVFYVQYAHARCASALRIATETGTVIDRGYLSRANSALLKSPEERAVLRSLIAWPRLLKLATDSREPHRVAFYLSELAGSFHAMWTSGTKDRSLRLLCGDAETARARLALVAATRTVIAAGLGLLGVSRPLAMARRIENVEDASDDQAVVPR